MKRTPSIVVTAVVSLAAVVAAGARSGTLADVLKQDAADRSGGRFERRGQFRDGIMARVCD